MDGELSFDEFVALMEKRVQSRLGVKEDEVFREAFKVFDKDSSGKLSRQEIKSETFHMRLIRNSC